MIREYALEPALLDSWDKVREIVSVFSLDQGRLISEFPKLRKWKRMVKAAYEANQDCMPVARTKIVEKLNNIGPKFIRLGRGTEDVRPFPNNEEDWLHNASGEHARLPFHAIIVRENEGNQDTVICWEDWDTEHALLRMENEQAIPRQVQDYVDCLAPLIRTSEEIVLVDRFFDPSEPRFETSFAELLRLSFIILPKSWTVG